MSQNEMINLIKTKYELIKSKDMPNDTSRNYTILGFSGQIGFISSMSDQFCGSCNRMRLTADGNLKVCLFSNKEINLRNLIRENVHEDEIKKAIQIAIKSKKFSHDGMYNINEMKNRPMIKIGG